MTIEEITTHKECQTFDCKSIQIDPKALAVPIVAIANADGGVLAIGVSAKTRRIEGVDGNEKRINELLRVTFEGAILQQVRSTIDYLETQVSEHSFLGEHGVFITRRNYSKYAIQEMVVNSCCHRSLQHQRYRDTDKDV